MNNNNNNVSGGGIGFTGLLTIVFIVLKLCKIINWSWVWVLSPIWISAALVIVILVIFFIIIFIKNMSKRGKYMNDKSYHKRNVER